MLKNYIKIALKVLLRRKFYTSVSLFGIAFTLMILVLCSATFDEVFSSRYPEVNLSRTLGIKHAQMTGPRGSRSSNPGYALLDRYARELPGVEHFSIVAQAVPVSSFLDGQKIDSKLRRTDGVFWEIMQFDFLEGGPFSLRDDEQGNFVAVINEKTRERFFDGQSALGKTLHADGQSFSVVGVVRNVPPTRMFSFAEIWVPISTAKSTTFRHELTSGFVGIVVAESRAQFPRIKAEFQRRLSQAQLPDPKSYDALSSAANTRFEELAYGMLGGEDQTAAPTVQAGLVLAGVGLLFMALPALNLINLNLSRILERSSEIGVRKAFGASSLTLVGQFLVESVVLTMIGGVIGLVLSEIVLAVFNSADFLPYAAVHVNYRVFGYGMLFAMIFGVFAGVYPAWHMSRMHPAEALHGRVG